MIYLSGLILGGLRRVVTGSCLFLLLDDDAHTWEHLLQALKRQKVNIH